MANRSKNIFAYLDSDDEDVPKTAPKKAEPAPGAAVPLNKGPNAGNKKTPSKKAAAAVEVEKKEKSTPREPREGGRGGARGGRGGARGGRGGARDYERRSGTGRGRETSKQGGGARNWGSNTDKSELAAEAEVQEGKPEGEDAEVAAEEAPVEEEEEEEVQLTLDEYLAKKKESRVGELFAEKEVRQVTDDFSAAVLITKEGKTPDFIEAQYEKVFTKKTSGRKKQVITDLGFQAAAPERRPFREDREGGRGGRGGERGGRGGERGRGAPRGGRATRGRGSAVPNVADMSAFPSL